MSKLIRLDTDKTTIFVGDTHGDFETTKQIIEIYPPDKNRLVFLGDYIDRGKQPRENIDCLLDLREKHKDNVILLMGNHEAHPFVNCGSDFFKKLNEGDIKKYTDIFLELPLAVSIGNIIALHGALPDLPDLNDINKINISEDDNNFIDIIWGDYTEESTRKPSNSRPTYNEKTFNSLMELYNKKILIRSHQLFCNTGMFDRRCLTIMTSRYYNYFGSTRRVVKLEKGINPVTIDDMEIIKLQ